MIEEITEHFKNGTFYFIIFFMLFGPALSDSNFVIQRMVQYEIGGVTYGSKASAVINMEAKPLNADVKSRNCIITRFQDLGIDKFRDITSKAGGLIVLLPENLQMSQEHFENLLLLEQTMISDDVPIPVYFAKYNEGIERVITDISQGSPQAKKKEPVIMEMLSKISENGYQVVVSGTSNAAKKDAKIPIIQGELIPFKPAGTKSSEEGHPVIIITSHLKTFGVANNIQPTNYDCTVFLALIEQLSQLYNQVPAKYRIMFMLHESGPLLNFQGVKKFLDVNQEESNVQSPEFVLCLDSIAEDLDNIFMHVSKPLKAGPSQRFYDILAKKAELYGKAQSDVVHSKINLAENLHKWAHERFSMRRFPAFTLSSIKSHTSPLRTTVFSELNSLNSSVLEDASLDELAQKKIQLKTKILAETLAAYIFQRDNEDISEVFPGLTTKKTFAGYVAPQSMLKSSNIKRTFEKFLKNVKVLAEKPDTHEPDFMLYEGEEALLNIYKVKPAVFDLFLTSLLACYLFVVYLAINHFPKIYAIACKLPTSTPVASTNGVNARSKKE